MLCDSLNEGDRAGDWGEVQEVPAQVTLWLIQIVVWKRPTRYCKTIILQLTINFKMDRALLG